MDLGIDTAGMSNDRQKALESSFDAAIKANEKYQKANAAQLSRADASFTIQRRGQNLPGDTGKNFGLWTNDIHGQLGSHNPFSNYPGSQFGGGFGGYGGGLGNGFSPFGGLGQGSYSAFRKNTKAAHYKMGLCVGAYKGFGLAKNVIDLMANFAAEGLKIKHPSKMIERFLNRWAFHIDLQGRVKDILRYYYKYGNVFIYRTLGTIEDNDYNRMKRSTAKLDAFRSIPGFNPVDAAKKVNPISDPHQGERIDKADVESKKELGKREIPWRYTLLNPFQMELRGNKFFGKHRWVFILDHETVNGIRNKKIQDMGRFVDFLDESDINLPLEFAKTSRKISEEALPEERNDPRVVDLDQTKLYTLHYMKDDHEDWAEPLLWPVMADIHYKNKLREMDISVCNSVINAVTIFKLGSLKDNYIPPESHFDKFSEFLRAPTQAMQMVWNDAISIESSYPPVEKILGNQKYESVDQDILRGIGIPDILIGGGGKGSFSTGFLGVRTLLERLEEGRQSVERWLLKEIELVVRTLGIRKMPTIKFGKMSLRDEQKEKQLIIQLLDRNIVSIEAVLEAFGEDFSIELERMRDEEKIRDETGLMAKHSPYPDPISDMDEEEKLKMASLLKQQETRLAQKFKEKEAKSKPAPGGPVKEKGPNGRPPGSDGIPHKVTRETKPQGMAWLVDYEQQKAMAIRHVDDVEKIVAAEILKATGKVTKRSLTKHEAKGIEDITFAVASQTPMGTEVTSEVVKDVLRNNLSIDGAIFSIYSEVESKETLSDRKVAMACAIAYANLNAGAHLNTKGDYDSTNSQEETCR